VNFNRWRWNEPLTDLDRLESILKDSSAFQGETATCMMHVASLRTSDYIQCTLLMLSSSALIGN